MLSLLLDGSANTNQPQGNPWMTYVMLIAIIVIFVVFMVVSSRKNKKRQQEMQAKINAVGPGNKVKTIGGICGIVVEVNDDDNTFVLETGSVDSGKSYIKFDKVAIYETDAVAPEAAPAPAEEKVEEKAEEKTEEVVEETTAKEEE